MPQNVRVRLNVGGTVLHTSLHTLMQGARKGSAVFQCLCTQILGHSIDADGVQSRHGVAWEQRVVPAFAEQYKLEHFIDADPTPFPIWLEYLRTGRIQFVDEKLMDKVILDTEDIGFTDLAACLRSVSATKRSALHAPSAKGAYDHDEDWVALLHAYGVYDKADALADNGICSAMDLHHMFESDVQQVRKDLKLPYSFNSLWKEGHSACAHIHDIISEICKQALSAAGKALRVLAQYIAITVVMDQHKRNVVVRKAGFEALVRLTILKMEYICTYKGDNTVGDAHFIVDTMNRHKKNAEFQQCGCWALSMVIEHFASRGIAYSDYTPTIRKNGYSGPGVIEVVLEAMRTHMNHTGVQEHGLDVLMKPRIEEQRQQEKDPRRDVCSQEVILEAFRTHRSHAEIQTKACTVLIAHGPKIPREVIIEMMRTHKSHAAVQEKGCEAVLCFAKIDSMSQDTIKIAELIFEAMRTHKSHTGVQENGCQALPWLVRELRSINSKLSDHKKAIKIVQQGGIEAILEAMRTHKSNSKVQSRGCKALVCMLESFSDEDSKAQIMSQIKHSDAEALVKSAMSESNCDKETQYSGPQILRLLQGV